MLRFEIQLNSNEPKIQFIGRDLNAPLNIARYNRALHYIYSLQINVSRIDGILNTKSHPSLSKYRDRIYKYIEKLIVLIEKSSYSDKRRSRNNLIKGMNLSRKLLDNNRLNSDLLKKSLLYLVEKPTRNKNYKDLELSSFYNHPDQIPDFSSINNITLSRKSFYKAIQSFKDTIDEIVAAVYAIDNKILIEKTKKRILKNISKISNKIINILNREKKDFNLSKTFFENALFIQVLSERPLTTTESGFDFDSAD